MAKEGYPFLAIPLLAAFALFLGGFWQLGILFLCVGGYVAYFFRDPERQLPVGESLVISPADGRILSIKTLQEREFLKQPMLRVSVFMNLLDVHVNRFPVSGKVVNSIHHTGAFFDASEDRAGDENERQALLIQTDSGIKMVLTQVAGLVARRIVCYPKIGEFLQKGQRMGLIRFGSRCDLFLPPGTEILVKEGDRVKAGETALAKLSE